MSTRQELKQQISATRKNLKAAQSARRKAAKWPSKTPEQKSKKGEYMDSMLNVITDTERQLENLQERLRNL